MISIYTSEDLNIPWVTGNFVINGFRDVGDLFYVNPEDTPTDNALIIQGEDIDIDAVKEKHKKVAVWYWEPPLWHWVDRFKDKADVIICSSKASVEAFRKVTNKPVYWIPQGCDRRYHYPLPEEKEHDVLFIGNKTEGREVFFKKLEDEGIGIKRFGRGYNKEVYNEDFAKEVSKATICLEPPGDLGPNFQGYEYDPKCLHFSVRPFLYTACGGYTFMPNNKDFISLFDYYWFDMYDPKDIKRTAGEIKGLLKLPESCASKAQRMMEKVQQHHTYKQRVKAVMGVLK